MKQRSETLFGCEQVFLKEFFKSYTDDVDEEKLFSTLQQYRSQMDVDISTVDFNDMDKWRYTAKGDIVHESGKFFRICGGKATNNKAGTISYQPVIDQPEQGILGIISRTNKDKIELLLQAKIEPGNLDSVQYSPTVQATRSNYTGAHKGKGVAFIESFIEESEKIKSRGFQSEHGYKFYKKANDNVHVHDEEIRCLDDKFAWLKLCDIKHLLAKEHCINMDTRSVLATIDFIGRSLSHKEIYENFVSTLSEIELGLLCSSLSDEGALHSSDEIYSWLRTSKQNKNIEQEMVPLKALYEAGWSISNNRLFNENNKNFELVGIKAQIGSREVSSWYQPIVRDNIPKVYAFLLKKFGDTYHILVQMVEEDFGWDGPELGPSIHSVDSETLCLNEQMNLFNINEKHVKIIYDRFQSEEGGRFMEQKNRYILIHVDDDVDVEVDDNFKWATLYQLKKMSAFECSVNIEARTLLAIASYYKDK